MGILDDLFGSSSGSAAAPPVPADASWLQRYVGLSADASDTVSTALGAIGAGLLTGDRYNLIGPGFQDALRQGTRDAELRKQKNALKLILKQANPSLPDEQIDIMANDPATAKLAMSLAETQAAQRAGAQADGILSGLLGGGSAGGVSNLGMGGAPRATPAAPGGPAAGASLNGGGIGGFVDQVIAQESGGNPNARNPNSTATGAGQFTTGTWQGLMRSRPDLGLTPDGRTDPEQSRKAIQALAEENAPQLAGSGHEVNPANLYMGHFLGGAGGVRFLNGLRNNPNAPASSYADPDAVAANRSVFFNRDGSPRTAQQVYDIQTRKFQGGAPTQTADASGRVGAPPPAAAGDGTSIQTELGPVAFTPSGGPGAAPTARPPVRVAETEADVQRMERGMYPGASAAADAPAAGAREAGFVIPPGMDPSRFPEGNLTRRAIEARNARAAEAGQGGTSPSGGSFALNDPAQAAKAIPQLMKVLQIPNLPDAQKAQVKTILDYALGVVKPTDRTRQLMEAGYTPGTPEYAQAYRNLVNADRTPSGYRYGTDGETLEPIPGGPQDPANRAGIKAPNGFRVSADGQTFEFVPGGPADPSTIEAQARARQSAKPAAAPKPLPHNAVKDLSEAGASYGDFTRLSGGFRPEYGGWKSATVGDAANSLARYTGIGNTEAADWWADYASKRNVVRNNLFGSALTTQEKTEFEKADITPGMTPQAIRKNLARQTEAATAAARKMAGYYVKSGRDPGEIEAALGIGLDQIGLSQDGVRSAAESRRPDPASSGARGNGAPAQRGGAPTFSTPDLEAEARRRGLIQ